MVENFHAIQLEIKLNRLITRLQASFFPAIRLSHALETLARTPFIWFEAACRDFGITRDADLFFSISQKSVFNSPLPPSHPDLATNLTDSQWNVLAPLLPPDPWTDHLSGQPPVIIAANRWGFSHYAYAGPDRDLLILKRYHQILDRCPVPSPSSLNTPDLGRVRRKGRPPASPRAILDAIIWKHATGHSWAELPAGFPNPRLCARYFRRLYRSGRWYTLVLALYNHFRRESSTRLRTFLANGTFTASPTQKIALNPRLRPDWENCTALLFMQLARSARARLQRGYKESHPLHRFYPDLKGAAPLSTGLPFGSVLPSHPSKPSPQRASCPAASRAKSCMEEMAKN